MISYKRFVRRFRFWFWVVQATFRRYLTRIIIGLVTLLVFALILGRALPNLRYLTSYKHGVVGAYTIENLPVGVMEVASRGLTRVEGDQQAKSDLAESWQVAEDGKKFIFKLKKGLKWQDGTSLKSKDLVYNFPDITTEVPDDYTIIFNLKNPISSFPAVVSRPVFKSRTFVGNGYYKVTNIEQVSGVVKSIVFTPVEPSLKRIVVNFYPSQSKLVQALKIGEINGATLEDSRALERWPNLYIEKKIDSSHFLAIYYNTKDAFLSAKEARQALSYAIDYSKFPGFHSASPLPPTSWAYNSATKKYNFDFEKSKGLLTNLQFTGSRKVTLSFITGNEDIANSIVDDWKKAGIDAQAKGERTKPGAFQAFLAIQEIPNDPDQYTLWHSTQMGSQIGLSDPKIDKFLEDGRVLFKDEERKEKYLDLQRVLAEDLPVTFLYFPNADWVYNRNHARDVEQLKRLNISF